MKLLRWIILRTPLFVIVWMYVSWIEGVSLGLHKKIFLRKKKIGMIGCIMI